jgi:predicted AAA+ superfamily ATPase
MIIFHAMRDSQKTELPRAAARVVTDTLRVMPVVVVTGARQTGKSTLVQSHPALAGYPYVTLDDPLIRDQAREDPTSILFRGEQLVLDEVQRAPDLLLAVKAAVDLDRPRRPGRYVLTGSANLLLMSRVSESLAGRAHYLRLWPLSRAERMGRGSVGLWSELLAAPWREWPDLLRAQDAVPGDWRAESKIGGLPVPAHELDSPQARALWFDGYVETYLERDLQLLARIESLGDFRRLVRAAALRVGSVLNQTDLARDVAVSAPTVHRWLNLLETSFQIVRVEAFAVNRTKRLIKSPKLYWSDVGLARHLAGGEAVGAHLENLILSDLLVWREISAPRPSIYHWRTTNQEEVDFVVEAGTGLLAIEVKAGQRPSRQDIRHLLTFQQEYGDAVAGCLLLHGGPDILPLADGVVAAPWWSVM